MPVSYINLGCERAADLKRDRTNERLLRKPKPQKCSIIMMKSVSNCFAKYRRFICIQEILFLHFSPKILPLSACPFTIILYFAEVVLLLVHWKCICCFTPLGTDASPIFSTSPHSSPAFQGKASPPALVQRRYHLSRFILSRWAGRKRHDL